MVLREMRKDEAVMRESQCRDEDCTAHDQTCLTFIDRINQFSLDCNCDTACRPASPLSRLDDGGAASIEMVVWPSPVLNSP